jgi:hypothetical protein
LQVLKALWVCCKNPDRQTNPKSRKHAGNGAAHIPILAQANEIFNTMTRELHMTGSGLVQFLINIIALLAAGGIFFVSIDKIAPDEFFAKIAKIAIGALLLIAFIVTIAAVFGLAGAGVTVSPLGILWFAIAVIVAVVVLYVINLIVDWIAANMGIGPIAGIIKYVLGAIVLIALLVAAANLLFGYKVGNLGLPRSKIDLQSAVVALPSWLYFR